MMVRPLDRQHDAARQPGLLEQLAITDRVLASRSRPAIEVPSAHTQDSGLQRVHAKITAHARVPVRLCLTVMSKALQGLGQLLVVRDHQAPVAERSEILTWKE